MNKAEFGIFCDALRTYYSKENLLPNPQAVELWYRQLNDIPYKLAETMLQQWVTTNKWSPSIADIRQSCMAIQEGELPDWGEGWYETQKAIRKFGYMNETKALESLSPVTRKTVQRLGWRTLCESEDETADRANFRQVYECLSKRELSDRALPLPLKETINQLTQGHNLISLPPGKEKK